MQWLGFQSTSNSQLTTKSYGEEWPRRPLRKKKIEESGSFLGKSSIKCQQNIISSVPRGKSQSKPLQECWELCMWGMAPPWLTDPSAAGGVEMDPPDHSAPTPHQLCPSPLCWHCQPFLSVPPHDLTSGSNLGGHVLRRWTKPTLCRGFFPCGCKIKEWERNLGCIMVSWWSTPSAEPCRLSKTLSFYPKRQAGLGLIQHGLQHNPIHREGYFWQRIILFFIILASCQKINKCCKYNVMFLEGMVMEREGSFPYPC